MNLLQIRQLIRTQSGRTDLVGSAGEDLGIGFYINAGQKYLDRLDETQKSWAIAFRPLKVGQYITVLKYCRAIKEVWFANSSGKTQLVKKDLQDMLSEYYTTYGSDVESGAPTYYSPTIIRMSPDVTKVGLDELSIFSGYVDIMSTNSSEYNAIIVAPPPSEQSILFIHGLFYSPELEADTDENYWSSVHPSVLSMAAMRELEVINRNKQGVTDWTEAIMSNVSGIGKDLVEELISEVDEMEG